MGNKLVKQNIITACLLGVIFIMFFYIINKNTTTKILQNPPSLTAVIEQTQIPTRIAQNTQLSQIPTVISVTEIVSVSDESVNILPTNLPEIMLPADNEGNVLLTPDLDKSVTVKPNTNPRNRTIMGIVLVFGIVLLLFSLLSILNIKNPLWQFLNPIKRKHINQELTRKPYTANSGMRIRSGQASHNSLTNTSVQNQQQQSFAPTPASKTTYTSRQTGDQESTTRKRTPQKALQPESIVSPRTWWVIGQSVIGRSHKKNNTPCQDSFALYTEPEYKTWGIAVVSDGMGSAKLSHEGSKYASTFVVETLTKIISTNHWYERLPRDEQWYSTCQQLLNDLRQAMDAKAQAINVPVTQLNCTLICVVYTKHGLLMVHVGDGRAAYLNTRNEWHPMMIPFRTEEANQTASVTRADAPFESRVIDEHIKGFVLMSDGCEKYLFECSFMDPQTQMWHDPNKPYARLLTPLTASLRETLIEDGVNDVQVELKLFLRKGTKDISNESDDKTLIIGFME